MRNPSQKGSNKLEVLPLQDGLHVRAGPQMIRM